MLPGGRAGAMFFARGERGIQAAGTRAGDGAMERRPARSTARRRSGSSVEKRRGGETVCRSVARWESGAAEGHAVKRAMWRRERCSGEGGATVGAAQRRGRHVGGTSETRPGPVKNVRSVLFSHSPFFLLCPIPRQKCPGRAGNRFFLRAFAVRSPPLPPLFFTFWALFKDAKKQPQAAAFYRFISL